MMLEILGVWVLCFKKNILNLRKILARTKPTQVGEVGTGLFDIAARVPCKKLIFWLVLLYIFAFEGRIRHLRYRDG